MEAPMTQRHRGRFIVAQICLLRLESICPPSHPHVAFPLASRSHSNKSSLRIRCCLWTISHLFEDERQEAQPARAEAAPGRARGPQESTCTSSHPTMGTAHTDDLCCLPDPHAERMRRAHPRSRCAHRCAQLPPGHGMSRVLALTLQRRLSDGSLDGEGAAESDEGHEGCPVVPCGDEEGA